MYFTRDPVIETVITSREGYKLSVRNTKHLSQDPFVVEAVEVISLGNTCFFRNCDHSKPFIVPAADYEVMEIRDTKINLKAVGLDRGIKIAGGREALIKLPKAAPVVTIDESSSEVVEEAVELPSTPLHNNPRKEKKERKGDKWKEKKKQCRRKSSKETGTSDVVEDTYDELSSEEPQENTISEPKARGQKKFSLLPPPPKLISEIISPIATDSDVIAADLDESLQVLATNPEVIDSLLSDEESLTLSEEDLNKVLGDVEEAVCEQPFPSSMEDE